MSEIAISDPYDETTIDDDDESRSLLHSGDTLQESKAGPEECVIQDIGGKDKFIKQTSLMDKADSLDQHYSGLIHRAAVPKALECVILFFGCLFNQILIVLSLVASGVLAAYYPEYLLKRFTQHSSL